MLPNCPVTSADMMSMEKKKRPEHSFFHVFMFFNFTMAHGQGRPMGDVYLSLRCTMQTMSSISICLPHIFFLYTQPNSKVEYVASSGCTSTSALFWLSSYTQEHNSKKEGKRVSLSRVRVPRNFVQLCFDSQLCLCNFIPFIVTVLVCACYLAVLGQKNRDNLCFFGQKEEK